ncbi:DUF4440 domain-containing protein [bacterium]|nr:DUF4440 domain-containing protein [bacterium]MCI0613303.1 DUF4440 domain-containing protein [bacterium]
MKRTIFTFFVFLFCMTLLNVAVATDEFKTAVTSTIKSFNAAVAAKDNDTVGSLYVTDAIAFPPNSEWVRGRDAIRSFWKTFMDSGKTAKVEVVETESNGNLGCEVGKYTILDASGKTIDSGKYLAVWKKGADGWRRYRDMWSSNLPAK